MVVIITPQKMFQCLIDQGKETLARYEIKACLEVGINTENNSVQGNNTISMKDLTTTYSEIL